MILLFFLKSNDARSMAAKYWTFVIIKDPAWWGVIIFRKPLFGSAKEYTDFKTKTLPRRWIDPNKVKLVGRWKTLESKNAISVTSNADFDKIVDMFKKELWWKVDCIEMTVNQVNNILNWKY